MNRYLKFAAQVVATAFAALVAALADNAIGNDEWINVAIATLGAISVLGAGNLPAGVWAYTKTIAAAATAGLMLLVSFLSDGVTASEWLQVAIAAAGAVGVAIAPGPRVLPTPGVTA